MAVNYYSYKELADAALTDQTDANLAALGEWFERYGERFFNGEAYTVDGEHDLYPIWEDHLDEDGEVDYSEVIGWELR